MAWQLPILSGRWAASPTSGVEGRVELTSIIRGLAYAVLCMASALIALAAISILAGCVVHDAQVSTQITLTSTADGLDLADQIVESAGRQPVEAAVSRVIESCRTDGCSGDEAVARLRSELAGWYSAVRGLEIGRASLEALQAALDTWVATGDLPREWGPLCAALGRDLSASISLLRAAGVDVPGALDAAGPAVAGVCSMVEEVCRAD